MDENLTNERNQLHYQTIVDLKEKIEVLEKNLTSLEATNQKLQGKVEELERNHTNNVANRMSVSQELQAETSVQNKLMNYEHQLKDLQKFTEKIGHRESGDMIKQENGPVLRGGRPGYTYIREEMKFKKPFSKAPKVIISWNMIDTEHSINLRLKASAEKITVDGFEFVVCTWAESIVHGFHATWTAYED